MHYAKYGNVEEIALIYLVWKCYRHTYIIYFIYYFLYFNITKGKGKCIVTSMEM